METETTDLDLPDDDELAEAFDMHSLIISSLNTDEGHLATADEVINEIEHMMQDSPSEESPEEEEEISEEMDSYTKVKETLKHLQTITETGMFITVCHQF
ncbi:fasciculation and elongation protein zeta-2-like [Octopus sinensis]|uniref:Fasciculation and elongation protein zeta-2-like n=1 Tax=Octopus sinensis TaxID=2607531 RepID=A0A7E6EIF9_9MOLL|nr:fasciculation and elongation protein zeta-2-like [Octopus sinensis]